MTYCSQCIYCIKSPEVWHCALMPPSVVVVGLIIRTAQTVYPEVSVPYGCSLGVEKGKL